MSNIVLILLLYIIWTLPSIIYLIYRFHVVKRDGGYITYLELTEFTLGATIPIVNVIVSVFIIRQVCTEIVYILDSKYIFYKETCFDENDL